MRLSLEVLKSRRVKIAHAGLCPTWLPIGPSQQANLEFNYQQPISNFQKETSTAEGVQFIGDK